MKLFDVFLFIIFVLAVVVVLTGCAREIPGKDLYLYVPKS